MGKAWLFSIVHRGQRGFLPVLGPTGFKALSLAGLVQVLPIGNVALYRVLTRFGPIAAAALR